MTTLDDSISTQPLIVSITIIIVLESQESSKYQVNGLSKQFGVYTFEDNQPLIERKARLIERLVAKKEPNALDIMMSGGP